MNERIDYDFAEKFSKNPGLRRRTLSEDSGEEFREDVLEDFFQSDTKILINVDGIESSLGSSFLSESFGKMAVKYTKETFYKIIEFDISTKKGKKNNDEMIKRVQEALDRAAR